MVSRRGRRGRLWTWPDLPGGAEVSEAIRLDMPSPLGARILLVVHRPDSETCLSCCTVIGRCWPAGQEPDQPAVGKGAGTRVDPPGPAEEREAWKIQTIIVRILKDRMRSVLVWVGSGGTPVTPFTPVTVFRRLRLQ